jgi:hypothetical protein
MPSTAADQRLLELLDRWLTSLNLHIKYSGLDEAAYRKVQNWGKHERPNRWIIDLAKQKTVALREQVIKRITTGDTSFSDALELTIFLANLVGAQHIERFIPLAEPQNERSSTATTATSEATREMPKTTVATGTTGTREMPKFTPSAAPPPATDPAQVARSERRPPPKPPAPEKTEPKVAAKPAAKPPGRASSNAAPPIPAEVREQVIADAVRLMQWGRKWYELAELISRLADRPPVTDVRRILKDSKAVIDQQTVTH